MVGLHGGTGVMCKASGGTGAMVCYAISEGDVALAVGGMLGYGYGYEDAMSSMGLLLHVVW